MSRLITVGKTFRQANLPSPSPRRPRTMLEESSKPTKNPTTTNNPLRPLRNVANGLLPLRPRFPPCPFCAVHKIPCMRRGNRSCEACQEKKFKCPYRHTVVSSVTQPTTLEDDPPSDNDSSYIHQRNLSASIPLPAIVAPGTVMDRISADDTATDVAELWQRHSQQQNLITELGASIQMLVQDTDARRVLRNIVEQLGASVAHLDLQNIMLTNEISSLCDSLAQLRSDQQGVTSGIQYTRSQSVQQLESIRTNVNVLNSITSNPPHPQVHAASSSSVATPSTTVTSSSPAHQSNSSSSSSSMFAPINSFPQFDFGPVNGQSAPMSMTPNSAPPPPIPSTSFNPVQVHGQDLVSGSTQETHGSGGTLNGVIPPIAVKNTTEPTALASSTSSKEGQEGA
ncbi:hypothetical protein BKA70DRAFT_1243157 [Coprinopsis sp. MPI-PUGE-AT-0042]|nr:hypothetical protein BKA70DRAFT_1243157 [Coprinopsis sp. MPI-PUGE-AT-0042]